MPKWELPPIAKVYEALSAVADGRVTITGDTAGQVVSSARDKTYTVKWSPDVRQITANDNASRWQGYTGYPIIAVLLVLKRLNYRPDIAQALAGVPWNELNKTYHVQLQVESIVLKGKNLPAVSPLVDANFAAEVDTLVLTAGHDVAKLVAPVTIDTSREGDSMTLMNGASRVIYANDMIMRDARGISCSIIYGQDNRSPISAETSQALYVCYAPAGVTVGLVELQLRKILENIRLFSPAVMVEQLHLLHAD